MGGPYNPEIHHRRSIRLKGHDYAGGGIYFVTICAHRDAGNVFAPADARAILETEWRKTAELRPYVRLGEFVIMPDHFHALIGLDGGYAPLGDVVGAFKAAVSRQIHRRGDMHVTRTARVWHRNYYECIVRDAAAEKKIGEYIRMNPWKCISYFGNGLRGIGNPALLDFPRTGVLCSRTIPDGCKLEPPESDAVFMGGFHSPSEKQILDRLLERGDRIVCCPAWGLKGMNIPEAWLPALEANRMLILEMKNLEGDLVAARERNAFVIRSADNLFVPHATPGGMVDESVNGFRF